MLFGDYYYIIKGRWRQTGNKHSRTVKESRKESSSERRVYEKKVCDTKRINKVLQNFKKLKNNDLLKTNKEDKNTEASIKM